MKKLLTTLILVLGILLGACNGADGLDLPAYGETTATPAATATEVPATKPVIGATEIPAENATITALETQVAILSAPTNTPTATNTPTPAADATSEPVTAECKFEAPGDENAIPKTVVELAPQDTWFHRVFNVRLFNAANNWGGADSWFVTLNLGPNSGGSWTSMGNPGQVVYRATSTSIKWCLGVLTTAKWKEQFMGAGDMPAAINVRIAPNSIVTVITASGKVAQQATSDMGDITITLPDSGVVTIAVDYTTAAPTHESLVWWGPEDRTQDINILDAR